MLLTRRFSSPPADIGPDAAKAAAGGLTAAEDALLAAECQAAREQGLIAWTSAAPAGAVPLATDLPDDNGQVTDHLQLLAVQARLQGQPLPSVVIPAEHPAALIVSGQLATDEATRVTTAFGQRHLRRLLEDVMDACDADAMDGFDPACHAPLGQAVARAQAAGVPAAAVNAALALAAEGAEHFPLAITPGGDAETALALPVTLSIPDELMEAALTRHGFAQGGLRHADAAEMLETIATQIWLSGRPHLLFRDRVRMPMPASKSAACTVRVLPFVMDAGFDAEGFCAAVRLLVLQAAQQGRAALQINLTDIAAALTTLALPYDSAEGRALTAAVSALATAEAALTAADLAARQPTPGLGAGRAGFSLSLKALREIWAGGTSGADIAISRVLDATKLDGNLRAVLLSQLGQAVEQVERHGLRLWPLTCMDEALAMSTGCTPGLQPMLDLIDFNAPARQLAVPVQQGLARLGLTQSQQSAITHAVVGRGTLKDAPGVNHDSLRTKGLDAAAIARLEAALPTARCLAHAVNVWTLGRAYCQENFGFDENTDDVLTALGFTPADIAATELYACGTGRLQDAPHLTTAQRAIFASADDLPVSARLAMQAAAETGLTAGVRQVLPLDPATSLQEVRALILSAWEMGVANLALYRLGCGLDSPVAPAETSLDQRQVTEQKKKTALSGR